MRAFALQTWRIISQPDFYFETVREERWWPAYRYLLITVGILSVLSPLAWVTGVDGASPVTSSLSAQMQVYTYWRGELWPRFGLWSLPLASLLLIYGVHLLLAIITLITHGVFRLIGGQGPMLHAFKAICYGLAPTLLLGFLPGFGVLAGVYCTVLQVGVGPARLYGVTGGRAWLLLVLVLGGSITLYWNRIA